MQVARAIAKMRWKIAEMHYLKTGAGYATGIVYTGVYPALSYEYRF